MVAALATGQVIAWAALYYAFSSFVLPMQRELGWSKAETMAAFSIGLAVSGLASSFVGTAIDRGHGRAVLTGGALLAALALLIWSQAATLPVLYAAWALVGLAMAMLLYDPAFAILTRREPERYLRGITALTLVGGFASTLAFPAVAALMAWAGWRGALLAIAAVLAGVVAPLHAWALAGPENMAPRDRAVEAGTDPTLCEAMRGRAFWLLTTTFTTQAVATAALWAHMMPALAAKGLDETAALAVVVWFGPAQVAGRFVYATFGARLTPRRLGLLVFGLLPASFALFAWAEQLWALLVFALLFGVANGLATIVRGGLLPQVFGRSHLGRIGGTISGIALLSRAAGPLLAAWGLAIAGGYREVLLAIGALTAVGFASFALAR
jgi:predicted MFS family arabinose efflux permease